MDETFNRRLQKIEEYLTHLEQIRKLSKKEFLADWRSHDAALRNFQVVIEACLDLGSYVISQQGWKTPESYADVIKILKEKKILPKELATKAINMAKFRNILVHDYLYIDLSKVYSHLNELDDIREFVKYLCDFIEQQKD